MDEYIHLLKGRRIPKLPRGARAWWAGGESFSPKMHLAFNVAPYIFMGKYLQRRKNVPGRILDLGCGTGYETCYLKEHFASTAEVTGIDRVLSLVKYAAGNYSRPGLSFLNSDASILPFQRESFDIVFAVFSIIHSMTQSLAINCLSEILRVLKPNGTLIFTTPNRERFQDLYHENPDDDPHLRFCDFTCHEYYREELRSLMLSFTGEKEKLFSTVSIDSITNTAFRYIWEETILTMKQRRFPATGRESIFSILARRFLPASWRVRYFYRMILKAAKRLNISLADIGKSAEYHLEEEGIKADFFLVIARKGK